MATQWISAQQAFDLIERESQTYHPELPICARAYAGLLRSKARLMIIGRNRQDRMEHVDLPPKFWWAKGHAALEQNWKQGDFSTTESEDYFQAFGVSFELSGLLDMVPVERRGSVSRELSVAGSSEWRSALAARRLMYEDGGQHPQTAGEYLIDQCRLGFVAARAVQMQRADGGRPDKWTSDAREWDIPDWFWDCFTLPGSSSQNWERGVFAGKGRTPTGSCWITLTGVYFAENALAATVARDPVPAPKVPTESTPGGRPPALFWDDLWCAMFGDIFRGFQPKSQGEIERAMMAWAAMNGHELGESTVKPRARKLLAEYRRGVENP